MRSPCSASLLTLTTATLHALNVQELNVHMPHASARELDSRRRGGRALDTRARARTQRGLQCITPRGAMEKRAVTCEEGLRVPGLRKRACGTVPDGLSFHEREQHKVVLLPLILVDGRDFEGHAERRVT